MIPAVCVPRYVSVTTLPKVASSSIQTALATVYNAQPSVLRPEWPCIAIVRHPLDRLVGAWRQIAKDRTFADFAAVLPDDPHVASQVDMFDQSVVTRMFRFEALGKAWAAVRDACPMAPAELPHLNRSDHEPWPTYFGPSLRRRMEDRYAADLALYEDAER